MIYFAPVITFETYDILLGVSPRSLLDKYRQLLIQTQKKIIKNLGSEGRMLLKSN